MAQRQRADRYTDRVVEFSSASGFPLKSEVCRCLTISGLLSSTPKSDIWECDHDNSLVDTK